MTRMDGRTALLRILADEGIDHIFGNPGTTELPLMDALVEHPNINYVMGLQEIVAMAMAEGYSRASGKASFVNLHVAPGLGNALGMLYTTRISGAPVIVTAGQHDAGFSLTEPLLYDPLVPIAQPFVKWAIAINRVEDLPRIVRRAVKLALTPPTGPVFLELPRNMMMAEADLELGASTRVESDVRPTEATLDRVAALLLQAERPMILAGHEVAMEDAFAEVAAVAEALGAQVYTQTVPHTAQFHSGHPLSMGVLVRDQKGIRAVLDQVDALLTVGADMFTLSLPSPVEPVPPQLKIVQVGLRDWELAKNFPVDICLMASVKATMAALARTLRDKQTPAQTQAAEVRTAEISKNNWSVRRAAAVEKAKADAATEPITPEFLMLCIAETLPAHGVIAEEGVTTVRSLRNFLEVKDSQRVYGLPSGGLGWGLPGAIGVNFALPDRPMIAIIGDGSAMYSVQGLYTAAQHKLPITYVICNNKSYRILKQRIYLYDGPAKKREKFIGMDFQNPPLDWCALGESFGLSSQRVTSPADLVAALQKGLDSKGPNLIDVQVFDGFKD